MVPLALELLPATTVPMGSVLFSEQQPCEGFPILADGRVKVCKALPNGRELLLYRIEPGQACVASIACLFGNSIYGARAVAESPVTFKLVPPDAFHAALEDPEFRHFVLHEFAHRLSELLALVDAVVSHRVDQRLAARLLAHGPDCTLTHQQLADELGSVREIVTRVLHHFAEEGWVSVGRGHIRLLAPEALRRFSQPSRQSVGDVGH